MTDAQEKDLTFKMLSDIKTWPRDKHTLDGKQFIHVKKRKSGGGFPTTGIVIEGTTAVAVFDDENPFVTNKTEQYMSMKEIMLDGWVID